MTKLTTHFGGYRPSLPDFRDHIADTSGVTILDEVDPRANMTAIYDQGQQGSCTANTVARLIDYDLIISGHDPYYPSREAIYFFERLLEGSPLNQDTGAYGRDGFKAARRFGIPSEVDWAYSDQVDSPNFSVDPRKQLPHSDFIKLAHSYKVVAKHMDHVKAVLSNRQMIAVGATLYESFESSEVAKTGIVPMPGRHEQVIGGHEFALIGYLKSEPHYVLCANSWSTEWGISGCFLLPWIYLLSQLVSDFRTIARPAGA